MKKAVIIILAAVIVLGWIGVFAIGPFRTRSAIAKFRQESSSEYWRIGYSLMQWAGRKAEPIVGDIPDNPGEDPQQYLQRVLTQLERWAALEETRRPMARRDILAVHSPYYTVQLRMAMLGRIQELAGQCETIEQVAWARANLEDTKATLALAE